jgi:ferritin
MENKSKLLNNKTVDALNYRIQQEEHSSRIYEQASLWLDNKGLLNCSKLFKNYADEEMVHATFAKQFLLDYGITPCLDPLPSPEIEYETLLDVFEAAHEHELLVTKQCNDLATLALKENNHVLYQLALRYCTEQQEEIGKTITLLDILKMSTDMLVVDHYIGDKLL